MKTGRVDVYLKAAELHLQRAIALADTEWKVSLAFWAALLASGISFISFTSQSSPPMTVYIAHSDVIFLIPYLITASIFIFGFSVNQAASIVEERTLYRYYLDKAARGTGLTETPYGGREGVNLAPIKITRKNRVWATKLLSTFLFVTGIWAGAQWLAHGKLAVIEVTTRNAKVDLTRLSFEPNRVACAFFDCENRGYWRWSDWPELGTVLWLLSLGVTVYYVGRATIGGQR